MTAADANEPHAPSDAGRGAGFFGRRKGKKLRPRQQDRLNSALPSLAVDLAAGAISPSTLFDRPLDRIELEIGFGGGEHLARVAELSPNAGFIGCEPFVNGVAKMLARIEALGLDNVRLHAGDGLDLLAALPNAALDRLYLLYPDPWPKRRQRKRRFVNENNLTEIARVLKPGAEFRFATDVDDYAAWTLARIARRQDLIWRAECARDWNEPWPDWPGTRYEAKAAAEGRRPVYLTFCRSGRSP
jgi:tRNA (guanine-N7-)-methyltransferase